VGTWECRDDRTEKTESAKLSNVAREESRSDRGIVFRRSRQVQNGLPMKHVHSDGLVYDSIVDPSFQSQSSGAISFQPSQAQESAYS